jgi:hypothetical protein
VTIEELALRVDERWRDAFIEFVQTGEADKPFLDYLDSSPQAQEAVEAVFTAQAATLENLAAALRTTVAETAEPATVTPGQVASQLADDPNHIGLVMAFLGKLTHRLRGTPGASR